MFRAALSLVLALSAASLAAAQDYVKPLISTSRNLHVGPSQFVAKEIAPDCPIAWSVKIVPLHGGKQDGVDLIVVDNGKLQITIIPTRGLGVLSVVQGNIRLGWDSPVKEVVHPKHINLQARAGLGWLEGFNEWMVRCGLESNGQPGTDKFVNNVGDESTMELTVHGKIANIPASEVELAVEKKSPYRLTIKGRVDEKMLFGPKLELHTEISTEPGTSKFRIADIVTNAGAQPQEFQMLYHVNFGKPLLEEGAKLVAPAERVTPFNARAAKDVKAFNTYLGPTPGYIEQVYLFRPLADAGGKTTVLLHNKAADRGASLTYALKELPYLTMWKNTGAISDGYVTGIEPGTNYPNKRMVERKFGRVPVLAGGASYPIAIEYAIHAGAADVRAVAARIAEVQKQKAMIVDAAP
jgi:hypothetical protein